MLHNMVKKRAIGQHELNTVRLADASHGCTDATAMGTTTQKDEDFVAPVMPTIWGATKQVMD